VLYLSTRKSDNRRFLLENFRRYGLRFIHISGIGLLHIFPNEIWNHSVKFNHSDKFKHIDINNSYRRFEVFTTGAMMSAACWDVTPYGSCKNRCFGGTYPNSLILSTLMMEVIRSSETLVLTRSTRRHIPEDDILHALLQLRSGIVQLVQRRDTSWTTGVWIRANTRGILPNAYQNSFLVAKEAGTRY
jgi:hypothetical protein